MNVTIQYIVIEPPIPTQHSSMPVPRNPKKSRYRPDVLPSATLYRVNTPTGPSPDHVSPSSSASSNDSAVGTKKGLLRRSSFRKLFRKKSVKKNQARRASAPIPHTGEQLVLNSVVSVIYST